MFFLVDKNSGVVQLMKRRDRNSSRARHDLICKSLKNNLINVSIVLNKSVDLYYARNIQCYHAGPVIIELYGYYTSLLVAELRGARVS